MILISQRLPQPTAVIFDLDGILINSEPIWQQAQIEVFREVGVDLTVEDCLQVQGLRIGESVSYWYDRFPWNGPSKGIMEARWLERVTDMVRSNGEPFPGARDAVFAARALGFLCAVASSSPRKLIDVALARLALVDDFSAVLSAQDEEWGKPHPSVYLSAAKALNVDPRRCIAVEDSINGLVACCAAQMRNVAIPAPENRADPRFSIAEVVLDSILELPETMKKMRGC